MMHFEILHTNEQEAKSLAGYDKACIISVALSVANSKIKACVIKY